MINTRNAILPDVNYIYALMERHYADGTLLIRQLPELCENVRDFIVAEQDARIIGCGALHLYGLHLAEIRSIAVDPGAQKLGAGSLLVKALLQEAERHNVICVCLFTRIPEFFARMGFSMASQHDLPDKMHKDCIRCPRFCACNEIAMVRGRIPAIPEKRRVQFAA